jgi:ABC-2 type transport system ATP-binding protein
MSALPTSASPDVAGGLTVRGVSKTWPGSAPVLDGIGFECPPGTLMLVSGRNGAGKTTLLRVVAGLIGADTGEVRFGALTPEGQPTEYRRRMGFLGVASSGLYPRLRVRHHLDLWSRLAYLRTADRAAGIAHAIEAFELSELLDRRPDRMSMGQRQRVRLAGTFLHAPSLLLLDEAGNSLDDVARDLLYAEVERARQRGAVLIWAHPSGDETHGLRFDSRFTLENGRLVAA